MSTTTVAVKKTRNTIANKALFSSRQQETDKMLELRNCGYSNAQIAQKTGVCIETVYRRIGVQSATLTLQNKRLSAATMTAQKRIRKHETDLQAARRYNELASEINNHIIAISEARKKLKAIRPSAVKNVPVIPMMTVIPASAIAQ